MGDRVTLFSKLISVMTRRAPLKCYQTVLRFLKSNMLTTFHPLESHRGDTACFELHQVCRHFNMYHNSHRVIWYRSDDLVGRHRHVITLVLTLYWILHRGMTIPQSVQYQMFAVFIMTSYHHALASIGPLSSQCDMFIWILSVM